MVDRSKYKPVEVAILTKIASEQDKAQFGELEFHKLTAGANKFKILPPHVEGTPFIMMMCVSWLPSIKKDGSEGKKAIFDSRFHSNKGKDLVYEYCKQCEAYLMASSSQNSIDALEAFKDYNVSIKPQSKYIMYALDITSGKVALLSVSKTIRDSIILDAANSASDFDGHDPFTDLDTGVPITITYDPKNRDPKAVYKYSSGKSPFRVSDEVLETFEGKPSLQELYVNSFKMTDLKAQFFGIAAFDAKYNIGYIKTDAWKKTVDDILTLFGITRAELKGEAVPIIEKIAQPVKEVDNFLPDLDTEDEIDLADFKARTKN